MDWVVGLLVGELLVLMLMIAEGLVLLGLAHILALIGALLTKGACLMRILCFLTRAYIQISHQHINCTYLSLERSPTRPF